MRSVARRLTPHCHLSVRNQAKRQGAQRIFLQTSRLFEQAQRFYLRQGFTLVKNSKTSWEVDFLELRLASGPAAILSPGTSPPFSIMVAEVKEGHGGEA